MSNKWFGTNEQEHITIEEYSKRVENNRAKLANRFEDIIHMILGIITELGELADIYKKRMAYGKEIDEVNEKEELGDILWYVIGLCNVLGFDFWDVLETNAKKLDARYKNGFTREEAETRDLEKERRVLEGTSKLEILEDINPSGWMENNNGH